MKPHALLSSLSLVVSLFAGISTTAARAQSESKWSVIIYDHGTNSLVELSPSGYTVTPLPDIGDPFPPSDEISSLKYDYSGVKVTDNRHYLVSFIDYADPSVTQATITDLITSKVVPVEIPPLDNEEIFVGYAFGAFNPSITEVALPYVSHDLTSGFGCCSSGGIVTVNLATGAITHRIDIDETYNQSTAWVDDWTTEGVWFSPRCSACTPPYEYTYLVWNPETNTVATTNVFHDKVRSERLTSTGELLYSENDPAFPLGGDVFPPRLNTVILYQRDDYPPEVSGQVVYYDDDNLDFDWRAHWIVNGEAFLVTNKMQHNVVVFRDGHQIVFDYVNPEYFLSMTSDGWLTFEKNSKQVRHYVVSDTAVTREMLYQASGEIEVANVQISPEPDPLPPFAINITPLDVFFCPGALPTRLKIGDWAEVMVDQQDYPIAALMVGNSEFDDMPWGDVELQPLPLGTLVEVIGEHGCTPNGWAYVKVKYQDVVGWMLEVWQTTYYLAPADQN